MTKFICFRKAVLVTVFLFFSLIVLSQQYFFTNYGVKEGLGHSEVKDIVQTNDGYVWIATKSGLSRFDGEVFVNYSTEDGLASFGVNALHVDKNGNMWIGHFNGGLSMYKNGVFTELFIDSINGDITDIIEDDSNNIWVSTFGNGVYKINNLKTKNVSYSKHYEANNGLDNNVLSMCNTNSLGILFVTRHGVKFFNTKVGEYEFINEQFYAWPRYFQIITVFEDSKGGIWVGTFNGGLYYYADINTEAIVYDKRDGLASNWVSEIVEDVDSSIWVGTWQGGISNIRDGKILSLNETNGLPERNIKSICVDIEGNVLIGTYSSGLSLFKSFGFINYSKFVDDKQVQVNAIVSDKNQKGYWLGTSNGLFHRYHDDDGKMQFKSYFKDDIELQSNDIRFLRRDIKGNVWIGTWGGGVSVVNAASGKIKYVYRLSSLIYQYSNFGNVTAFDIDNEGHLWVGTPGGLFYYEPETNQVMPLSQGNNLQNNDIVSIYCDNSNAVWVGHNGGGVSKIIGTEITRIDFGFVMTPTSMYGNDKDFWIGTLSKGVYHYSNDSLINHYTIDDGLGANSISAIEQDNQGNIIIGTNRGLNKIETKTGEMLFFGAKQGFIGIEVKNQAFFKNSVGDIWVGTSAGLTVVKPKLLKKNIKPPIIVIRDMKVNLDGMSMSNDLTLLHDQNAILFDYKAICISDASAVRYKVRLLGAEQEWQPETKQTYANFPALPPGEYVFEVVARNNSGVWNPEPKTFAFRINPPFWQTLWFISLVIIVLIVSVVLFVKIREKQLVKEKVELENKVQERTVEISQKNDLLAKKNKDITDSINYARRIQRAIMPPESKLKELLHSSFIFYKPKDIVSGDFHWNTFYNGRLILTAADCTGHGVPGAFMSMISISSLNKIVKEKKITDPARILDNLRYDIVNDLKQSGDVQAKDGLDLALLSIEPEKRLVHYAGAYNSMYIVKSKKVDEDSLNFDFNYSVFGDRLIEIKADRMPIGISERMDRNFTTKTLQMEQGDSIFISTDGYIDQFGGEKGKKFMSKRFKKLLLELPYAQADESLKVLENQFVEWRGVHEQIDDVLVMGISF